MSRADSFTIGRVTGVHGLKGFLKVWSFAESIDSFSPGKIVLLKSEKDSDDPGEEFTILGARAHKKGVLLVLEGVDTRELAQNLVGREIHISRAQLAEPEEDSWYWQDLLGLDVLDHEKGFIGKVMQIFPTGANDILVVRDGARETLVPMHENFVDLIDIEKKRIKTTLPPELLAGY